MAWVSCMENILYSIVSFRYSDLTVCTTFAIRKMVVDADSQSYNSYLESPVPNLDHNRIETQNQNTAACLLVGSRMRKARTQFPVPVLICGDIFIRKRIQAQNVAWQEVNSFSVLIEPTGSDLIFPAFWMEQLRNAAFVRLGTGWAALWAAPAEDKGLVNLISNACCCTQISHNKPHVVVVDDCRRKKL